jgi:N-formylglutamate deformylase
LPFDPLGIPFLFEGTLPDFNIGTNKGETCAP